MCSGYKSFLSYVTWKYCLPGCGLTFSHAIESVEIFSVNKIQLPVDLLMDHIFGVIFKKSWFEAFCITCDFTSRVF